MNTIENLNNQKIARSVLMIKALESQGYTRSKDIIIKSWNCFPIKILLLIVGITGLFIFYYDYPQFYITIYVYIHYSMSSIFLCTLAILIVCVKVIILSIFHELCHVFACLICFKFKTSMKENTFIEIGIIRIINALIQKHTQCNFKRVFQFNFYNCSPRTLFQEYFILLLPLFLDGIIPLSVALYLKKPFMILYFYGLIYGCCADITQSVELLKNRSKSKDQLILSHPTERGFTIMTK